MSSEKQYNNIEGKIIEAANSAEYAFKEEAWQKMEQLLDKKKDKRRPIFWLFSFAIVGVLFSGILIYQKTNNSNKILSSKLKNTENRSTQKNTITPISTNTSTNITEDKNITQPNELPIKNNNVSTDVNNDVFNVAKNETIILQNGNTRKTNVRRSITPSVNNREDEELVTSAKRKYTKKRKSKITITAANVTEENNNLNEDDDKTDDEIVVSNKAAITNIATPKLQTAKLTDQKLGEKKPLVVKKDSTTKTVNDIAKTTEKKSLKKKALSSFYLLGSVGAEASSTNFLSFKDNTITPKYGLAIGYQFNNKLSVQAGIFASAKKYIAGPNDYSVKAGSYLSTVKIITVDANCLVYEIPLTVQYNWLTKPSLSLYSTIGVSSYVMKKEKYNYTYERYNAVYQYPYDYTGNTHLLATFNLSVGIEKKIKNNLYLQVAPTFNLPLSGVGDGKVKLFTTSLNLGLKFFPFKK